MGRAIRWSKWVLRDLSRIQAYWDERTGTTIYSDRLTYELVYMAELLSMHPSLGKMTIKKDVYQKIQPLFCCIQIARPPHHHITLLG